jgi:hypothetical protein
MKLSRPRQVVLWAVSLGVLGIGVTAAMRSWASVGIASLILPGLLLVICAIAGGLPNMNLKELSVEWPKFEEPKPDEPARIRRRKTSHSCARS